MNIGFSTKKSVIMLTFGIQFLVIGSVQNLVQRDSAGNFGLSVSHKIVLDENCSKEVGVAFQSDIGVEYFNAPYGYEPPSGIGGPKKSGGRSGR
jgi:hypothetical protein